MIAHGSVVATSGGLLEIRLPGASVGDAVAIDAGGAEMQGVVCSVGGSSAFAALQGSVHGIAYGAHVRGASCPPSLPLGLNALGRAFDALARPLDGGAPLRGVATKGEPQPVAPHRRASIDAPLWSGVRAIDGLLTFGRGARVGIFGAPGTGKSTLVESIACGARADAVVLGLIGERGREAQRWIERLDARTSAIVATSDRSAAERVAAAQVSAAQAHALRARGLHVLWVLDSLARVAQALRELGVASGESTGRGGYPPSTFAALARLVEIAGPLRCGGSITLIASVLDDGDDRDPVSDAARSLLDGHVVLSSRVAAAGRFPSIDVTASASRTMDVVAGTQHRAAAAALRAAIDLLDRTEDARTLGIAPVEAYAARVVECRSEIEAFLRQGKRPVPPAQTLAALAELADTLEEPHGYH